MKICVMCNDKRFSYVADFFENDGYYVSRHFTDEADVYVFPILFGDITEDLSQIPENSTVFAGYIKEENRNKFLEFGIDAIDYLESEELLIKNAIATAEGGISLILQNHDKLIYQSKSLVLGGGRIAKLIAQKLQDLGSNVTVALRNETDMVRLNSQNISTISLCDCDFTTEYDYIINTIPSKVIKDEELCKIDKNTYILDLSSKPYGLNFELASELALHVEIAPGLPSLTAPHSAGRFIYETILEFLKEKL